jgi:putative two-component system response regulator
MFDLIEIEKKLLIIEDEQSTRKLLTEFLGKKYICDSTDSAEAAIEKIKVNDYSIILSDISLPKMSGVELIPIIKNYLPNAVIILISGKQNADYAIQAFREGAFDYIQKPFSLEQIETAIDRAFEHYELKCIKERYQHHLEVLVSERAVELDSALEEVENSYRTTLKALVQALETRDFETHGHSERVVTFSLRLGHELGLNREQLRDLELGALLHDIGKIGVPDAILRKPAKLNEDEWAKMKLHPIHGQKILRNIPFLQGAARVVCQHHERWDGLGYPYGLRGVEIDIGARIFSVVDAFDAMISDRVYRKGRPYYEAVEELEKCAGTQFDIEVVEAFKQIPREDWEILRNRSLSERKEVSSFQAVVTDLLSFGQTIETIH